MTVAKSVDKVTEFTMHFYLAFVEAEGCRYIFTDAGITLPVQYGKHLKEIRARTQFLTKRRDLSNKYALEYLYLINTKNNVQLRCYGMCAI